jgi:PAS domain S-box-containing protein
MVYNLNCGVRISIRWSAICKIHIRASNFPMADINPNNTVDHEQPYHESQTRFETIFESSSLGNKIISSDLKIKQVNPALVELLGYQTKEEIIGTRILDYTPAEHHKDWAALREKLWKLQVPSFTLETRLIKKDGSIIWCKVISILFKDNGETLGYTIIEDISEQHKLKVHKEDFIGIASHELNTALTSLQACLQLLNRMIKTEAVITNKIIRLSQSSELYMARLSKLVSDLLNTTNIEQGHLNLNKSKFKVSEIIEECCNHLELEGKHYITTKGNLLVEVVADKNKLDQVLVNLVNNAAKYAPNSQEIVIEVEELNNTIKMSVIDKGEGIAKHNIADLFNRYYQVKKEQTHSKGLGLGLYISAEIIEKHKGEIGVESEFGKGSTFWFTIPLTS